jgi:hypothetical protein
MVQHLTEFFWPVQPATVWQVIEALREKYGVLAALRRERDEAIARGEVAFASDRREARGRTMRELAGRFPGALRELEAGDATLFERKARTVADDLARRAAGQAGRAWIDLVVDFHALLREALALKHALALAAQAGPLEGEVLAAIGRAARARLDRYPLPTDPASLVHLFRPERGRLMPHVWAILAERHGGPPGVLAELVFGAPDDLVK